jgi:alkaline phosphatase D
MKHLLGLVFWMNCVFGYCQTDQILSGPMVGQVQLRDVIIWVQTSRSSNAKVTYLAEGSDAKMSESKEITTNEEGHFIATFYLKGLQPGTKYNYKVWIDNKLQSFPDYDRPGKGYGSHYHIYKTIDSMKPDFMLWLGDNTYLREGDFESKEGIYHRQSHTRTLPEMRPLMAHTPNYAIWDDHDYGTNDANRTYRYKNHSLAAFKDFWPAESYHTNDLEGISHSFTYNDCEFFMLDNRWYKTADTSGTILGRTQIDWFKDALLSSNAAFKFVAVGGQFLSDFKGFENMVNYPHERQEIIDFIDQYKIKNVVFLTGDRHSSELTKYVTKSGITIYDITSSALTSGTSDHGKEPNTFRIGGSMIGVNNFAKLTVSGDRKNRKLNLEYFDANGKLLFQYNL